MDSRKAFIQGACFTLACLALALSILSYAWVTEDAYITFRVVDNAVKGFGLRWNIDEAVQVYTHPLWLLLHIPAYAAFGNIFLVTSGISALCAAVAFYWLVALLRVQCMPFIALVVTPALLSVTIMSFAMCGLEVPLSWATLGGFFYVLLRHPGRVHLLCFAAALAMLTRFDNLLFMLPALGWHLYRRRRSIRPIRFAAAWSPMWLWCAFSLIYYGFIFPNSKYAKLHTGLSELWYFKKGIAYTVNFLRYDFFGAMMVLASILCGVFLLIQRLRKRELQHEHAVACVIGLGMALHTLYVIRVGGDYMSGRFYAISAYLALWPLCLVALPWLKRPADFVIAPAMLLLIAAGQGRVVAPLAYTTNPRLNSGVVDERAFYLASNKLFYRYGDSIVLRREPSTSNFARWGKDAPYDPRHKGGVAVFENIGMYGYYAADKLVIIDPLGLGDALLARMPSKNPNPRVGHFAREVPRSYIEARRTGKIELMPPPLADYYRHLRLVTSGDIWNYERLKTILKFQLGYYQPPKM